MPFKCTSCIIKRILFLVSVLLIYCAISFGQNPIITENALPGVLQAIWDAGDNAPIEGFAQEFSVNKGDSIHFKIDIESPVLLPYTVKIYRLGWYQGNGARFIEDLGNSLTGKQQPAYNYEASTGKVDCSNWAVSAAWKVPSTAVSGVYIARLDCPSLNAKSILLFIVRDDAANSALLFKTSDATWQAYNNYGGNTFYTASTPVPGFTHATKVSYQRILHLRGDKSNFFNAEYPMLRWLEKNGYNVSYSTDMDMARDPSVYTPSVHKALLSIGHDEYWSNEQRTKFENARANGVHIAFFSGNEVYWKTRWENNYQTLVCYKEGTQGESVCGAKCDPLPTVWTGLWRDGCSPAYPANDGCRPEGTLTGQMSWTQSTGSIKVPDSYKNLRFWKNTSVATLGAGQTTVLPYGTLGNEWDPEQFTGTYPAHRIVLSNTFQAGFTHKMSLYKYSSGALVFGSGTMQWAWGLDDDHDLNTATPPLQPVSTDMQQATVNLFYDMGVTAGTLQPNLVAPTIGPDVLAPSSTIVSPVHNTSVSGSSVTISGTSVENGTSSIAGVEVSIDNGSTWNTANGLENWTYTFSPSGYGTITIKVRAWDDLGNVETPGSPGTSNCINVSLTGPFSYSVFNSSFPVIAPTFFSGNPVELGMKFRSSVSGNITGFRYYKGQGVTGVHTGHLWSNTGTLLAEAIFTNETASGWQTVTLNTPVAISINTTYIVSYFSASGDFTKTDQFFSQPVVNGFLRGLADGEEGGNGVYNYSAASSFPANTFSSANYFADVIFESNDVTAPQVSSVTPADNSNGIFTNIRPFAILDETLNPVSVTRSTVLMKGPGNVPVSGTITLTGGSTITFAPNSELAASTTYTVTLKGGSAEPVIKDLIGNNLATNYTWSFTTGALSVPSVVTKPASISTCSNSNVSFLSTAIGIPVPTVQWQKSIDNGFTWNDIPGATSGTYSFIAVYADNNNQYRAVWTNSQGHDNSIPAVLTVYETVSGTITAVNLNICPGAAMELQLAAATGPSPYSLQINSTVYDGITVGQPFRAVLNKETIWPASNVPSEPVHVDNNSVEVGVKFQTNKNGLIRGIRFYKGSAANGGTHIGSLWSQSGTLLASATFVNETSVGWQQILFATPVEVTANTTYIASYFLPMGNYSRNGSYFNTSYSNGNSLVALQNTAGEPNAVYAYSSQSTFPTSNFGDPNYWVDVVFTAYAPTATTTFNLTSVTAANGCTITGNPLSSATITIGAPVDAGVISGASDLCIGATSAFSSNGSAGGVWSSSNTAVATVNQALGIVTATGPGTATITYTITGCNGTFSASRILNVAPNANPGIVNGTSPLCIGATATYSNNGDTGGTWSSSNATVASVNAAGLVTALTAGTTNITYTINSGCNSPVSSFKTLTVNPNVSAGIVSGNSPLCIGSTVTYSSSGNTGGAWSSSNASVATVNAAGLVTAFAAGTTNITYTINSGCNSPVFSFITLTVTPNISAGFVSGASPLCIGSSATYSSSGNAGGTWSSSNISVASVNAAGLVTALTAGTTNITYTINSGCNSPVSSFSTLTVNPNVSAGTVSGTTPLCIGSTATYSSSGNTGGAWSSSNESVATVNAAGLVTALTAGTTNITYTINSGCNSPVSSFKTLTVNPNVSAGIVSGNSPLCIGSTATYSSSGNTGGIWSSSNATVATVNAAGLVTALTAGTANITYSLNAGCGGPVSSFKTLTVSPNVNAGLVSGTSPLCIGSTATFSSSGNTGGTWSSSNTSVATVNAAGLVTALTAGTANITYSLNTGCGAPVSSMKTLTVNPNVSAGVVSGFSPLCIGSTATYMSSGNTVGTWSSSATGIATVNPATGLVSALSPGTTTISYTVNGCNGPATASKVLTVASLPQGSLSANGPFTGSGTGMLTWTATTGTGPFTIVYFDGVANRTALVTSGVPFNVFTNPVTSTTTYTLVSVSDANCIRTAGFTRNTATITVTETLCPGYTILGLNDVVLDENNIIKGNVGNTGQGKKIELRRNSSVNGYVKASMINLQTPVTVTGGLFYAPVVSTLPLMLLNTAIVPNDNFTVPDNGIATINANYNNLRIGRNAVVTINGNIYGTIQISEAAIVTFTASDINIDDLKTDDGYYLPVTYTTIKFTRDAIVRIKNKVVLGARNRINESSPKKVTFYLGDKTKSIEKFKIDGTDTRVTAGIYLPNGKVVINRNGPCVMTGTIIAEDITTSPNVTWNCGYPIPGTVVPTTRNSVSKAAFEVDVISSASFGEFSAIVFPNPSFGEFRLKVTSKSIEPVTVLIMDVSGKIVRTYVHGYEEMSKFSFGSDLRSGSYFVKVKQGVQVKVIKLVKLN